MKKYKKLIVITSVVVLALIAVVGVVAARSSENATKYNSGAVIPQPDVTVKAYPGFAKDIQPIFSQSCVDCHGSQNPHNGLSLDSYEGVMKGTQFGSVVVPGESAMSPLVALIKHETDSKIWMPYHKEQLSPNRIKNIENWIRYGARNN